MSGRSIFRSDDSPFFAGVVFFLLAVGLSALTLSYPGTPDVGDFIRWSGVLNQSGPLAGYAKIADYPPLGPFLLWVATAAGRAFGLLPFISIKLAIDTFQLASALIIRHQTRSWTAAALLFLIITPFGALLGYIDVFYLPFILLGVFALQSERLAFAALMFAVATLIKWQPAILCPIAFIHLLGRTGSRNLAWPLPAAVLTVLVIMAFGPVSIWTAFAGATNDPLFSGQAFNLDWIVTYLLEVTQTAGAHLSSGGSIRFINHLPPFWYASSRAFFWLVYLANLVVFALHKKTQKTCILALLSAESIQFTFNTGVHENHSFLVMILAFIAYIAGDLPLLYVILAAALAISNVLAFYGLAIVVGQSAALGTILLAALDIFVCAAFIHRHVAACRLAGLANLFSRRRLR